MTVARRIAGGKTSVALAGIVPEVTAALDSDHDAMYAAGLAFRDERTVAVATVDEAAEAAKTGWATIPWATLGVEGEAQLAKSAITVRCLTLPDGSVPTSEDNPEVIAVVARAY